MKKISIAFMAIAFAIGVFAFTQTQPRQSTTKLVVPQWFIYIGEGCVPSLEDATNPNNYRPATDQEVAELCLDVVCLCAIKAEPDPSDPSKPLISGQPIESDLATYVGTGGTQPGDNIKEKEEQ